MTDQPTPADWAIELALEPVNAVRIRTGWHPLTAEDARSDATSSAASILAHAAMIQKYEPHRKPVDRVLEEARKVMAQDFEEGSRFIAEYLGGKRDGDINMRRVIAGIRRGMELAKESGA